MAVNIARPTTALAAGTGLYGNDAGSGSAEGVINANGSEFAIKAFSVDLSYNIPVVEVTGSGDTAATFLTGKVPAGTFKITGCMVVQAALGIAKLKDQDTFSEAGGVANATVTPDAKLTLAFGGHADNDAHITNAPVYIEGIQIQHRVRQGAIVGVVLSGRFSGVAI